MATGEIVEVLLATLNGERFLREQVDSLLAQDYANLRVLARDDGSSDRTLEILREYQEHFPDRVRLLPADGPTGSAKGNFLKLMQASSAEYLCFCDQDDVWLPDKVSRSMNEMRELESRSPRSTPCLVFTDLQLVDSRLKTIHTSFWKFMGVDPENIRHLKRLLLVSVVTGSTAMVNRPLLELARRMPQKAVMHDRWIGLIAATMGTSSPLTAQTVLYRQHGNNVIGTGQDLTKEPEPTERIASWKRMRDYRKGPIFENWVMAQGQAEAFLAVYRNELRSEVRRVFELFRSCGMHDQRLRRLLNLIRFGFEHGSLSDNLERVAVVWNEKCG